MFNNVLPVTITTAVIVVGSFLIWCIGTGADRGYFFEWLPMCLSAAVLMAAIWAMSEGDAPDYYDEV
ncbi:MAG: hypothetical protein BA864_10225 [Desulfuromonadales bacterium C00003093]|nr:MAG: hypothetical protein BA864_10225 [Desulfuromonadales bacterium C00003093]